MSILFYIKGLNLHTYQMAAYPRNPWCKNHYQGRLPSFALSLVSMLALWLFTPQLARSEPTSSSSAKPAIEEAIAEPISPDTLKRHGHLASYVGHVLLGGHDLQVVLAGVPSRPSKTAWQPAILAAFERNRDGPWRQVTALNTLEFRLFHAGTPLTVLGLDIATTSPTNAASITIVYGDETQSDITKNVTYRLDENLGRLSVIIADAQIKTVKRAPKNPDLTHKNADRSPNEWGLRISNPDAGWFLSGLDPVGSSAMMKSFWRYDADSVVTLTGYVPLSTETKPRHLELKPMTADKVSDSAPPIQGYEITFGKIHTASTLSRAAKLFECLYGAKKSTTWPSIEKFIPYLQECGSTPEESTLQLSLSAEDPGGDRSAYPVFVFDDKGKPLAYTALFAGETLSLSIPAKMHLRLSDTLYGRMLSETMLQTLEMSPGITKRVELLPRRAGLIRINGPEQGGTALLSLKRIDSEASILGLRGGQEEGCFKRDQEERLMKPWGFQEGFFLATSWPVYCELLGSTYALSLQTIDGSSRCDKRVHPQPTSPQAVSCSLKSSVRYASKKQKFAPVDLAFPDARAAPLISGLGMRLVAAPIDGNAKDLRKVLGMKSEITKNLSYESIPTLRITDENSDIAVQFLPATPDLLTVFQRFKQRRPDDSIGALLDAVRATEADGFLELGCPNPSHDIFDYELLVRRTEPDGLRLFGCPWPEPESDLVSLWARLGLQQKKPFLLMPNSSAFVLQKGGPPRLMIPNDGDDLKSALVQSLASQSSLVTRGPILELSVAKANGRTTTAGRAKKNPMKVEEYVATFVVDQTPLEDGTSWNISLYTDKGLIKTINYPALDQPPGKASVGFTSPGEIRWVRAELTKASGLGIKTPLLMAITNWKPVTSADKGLPQPVSTRPASVRPGL